MNHLNKYNLAILTPIIPINYIISNYRKYLEIIHLHPLKYLAHKLTSILYFITSSKALACLHYGTKKISLN